MRLCSIGCTPCCDFCIHVVHDVVEDGRKQEPIGCHLHEDYEHQCEVRSCGCCDDFHCMSYKPTQYDRILGMSVYEMAMERVVSVWNEIMNGSRTELFNVEFLTSDGSSFSSRDAAVWHEVEWLNSFVEEGTE